MGLLITKLEKFIMLVSKIPIVEIMLFQLQKRKRKRNQKWVTQVQLPAVIN